MKYDISICLPCRNEMFLKNTVEDILKNRRGKTEIIIGLDGAMANPEVENHKDVRMIYFKDSIGQRQITDKCVELSNAKYIIKADGHCAFDEGFDVKMLEAFKKTGDNVAMVPVMRNLHAFNWVCPDGHRRYQSPSGPCTECGKPTTMDIVWIPKISPQSVSYCFDSEPHFQYFKEFSRRPEYKKDIKETGLTESMSLQGSFFMMTREKYWELNIGNEEFGSWGSQAIQVACSFWLSGGRVMVNHNTWYGHMFRTQGGDFGFPYPQSGRQVHNAKKIAGNKLKENNWPNQIHPSSWLLEKFWPVKGWTEQDLASLKKGEKEFSPSTSSVAPIEEEKDLTKGIIFYTDNRLNVKIAHAVQRQLKKVSEEKGIPIVSVSLKPMDNMGKNIHLPIERGRLAMVKQILVALEASTADIIFWCEHDVLYPSSHFDFTPKKKDVFYYNQNFWKIRTKDNLAIHYDANQLSSLCCDREFAIKEYRERVRVMEIKGWRNSMGYEPGTRGTKRGGFSDYTWESWKSATPLIDIKHGHNLTTQRWHKEQFRNQENCTGWLNSTIDKIEGWTGLKSLLGWE